ncbi:MAG: UDP-3-O-(3-hydroxymyristoyl)glucosamine N-acyltransferase [Pirellulales bacterium]|nr:UDP-3-O-(3-hydroxymyristoyl)glucosamine N-acyltransferase [Pirellulales bacterium]
MSTTLADLAELVHGRLCGDPVLGISGAATLGMVAEGQITLADGPDFEQQLAASPASAAIVSPGVRCAAKPTIIVDDVHAAFAKIVMHFRPVPARARIGISPQASVSPSAQIAEDVDIHPFAQVGDDVVIGPGSTVYSGACVMHGCAIGSYVTLFPNVVLYENTKIGDRSILHAGAVIGAYGFGYSQSDGAHELSAQLGFVELGSDVEIGACAAVDRGTYGPTVVGEGSKIDDLVQIAHNCRLGKHNLICGQVGIAGSTTTGDHVVMAGQVGVRDHVHIGSGAVLCSKAGISNNIEAGEVVLGQPATSLRKQKLQMAAISKLPEMRKQFRLLQRQMESLLERFVEQSDDESDSGRGEQAA